MPDLPGLLRRHRRYAGVALAAILLLLGLVALQRLTREVHFRDVRAAFHAIGSGQILAALALTVASYLALTLYDVLALRILGRALPWRTAALASFTSNTISYNLGLPMVTGGSARYRIYSEAGLDLGDVARIVAIASATFWSGVVALVGLALLLHPQGVASAGWSVGAGVAPILGALTLLALGGAVVLCARGPRRLRIGRWTIPLPGWREAAAQIAVASFDVAAAGAALFVLLPHATPALLPAFVLGYALAIIAGLVTHVPGGLGVFEAVVLATVPGDRPALFAALIVYRAIYYVLPLAGGIALLAWNEARHGLAGRALAGTHAVVSAMAPLALSAATFAGGAILLMSGALPAVPGRLDALRGVVPLPFVNASHLAASLVGTALLLIAPGLYRRLDGAAILARFLLVAGAVFSLAKGIDYEEATVCLIVAALIQWTHRAFYRRTELVARPLSPTWLVSVTAVIALSVWVGFFSYKRVDYSDALWWQFAWSGNASRFLRATLGVGVVIAGAALWRLFAPAPPRAARSSPDTEIDALIALSTRTEASLAWIGDKRLLFAPARDAALMYQVKGNSWVVMADPVGNRDSWADLLWQLRNMADAAQGRLILYQISGDVLEIAVEMGLQIVKYGEEAIIDLPDFSLQGSAMRSIRQSERRAARDGATFEIVPRTRIAEILPDLTRISDHWLAAKRHREKGFSLGRFDTGYIRRFDCAVVRVEGRIVAFANIWATPGKEELSVDLMRHDDAAPSGTMDFLFANLMLWGRDQGYARFTLGLAPLSGIEARRLSPVWAKAASLLFQRGERLYGFRGLRAYKSKFVPRWEPRYIAGPQGMGIIRGLRDLQRLVNAPVPQEDADDTPPAADAPRVLPGLALWKLLRRSTDARDIAANDDAPSSPLGFRA